MMQRAYLAIREIFSGSAISAVVLLSVACSSVIVAVFDMAGDGVNRYISDRFTGSIPPNTIKVAPRTGPGAQLFQPDLERPGISEGTAARIGRLKGVTAVHPVLPVEVPAQAGVHFFGFGYRVDVPVLGVPFSLVKESVAGARYRNMWKNAASGGPVPVIVPGAALQAYNDSIAGPNGLPRISGRFAPGIKFTLLMGRSSIRSLPGAIEETAEVAGVADSPKLIAILLPLHLARWYNRKFDEAYRVKYCYLYVNVKDHAGLVSARESIRRMNLQADSGADISENILRLQESVALSVALMKYLVGFLSLVAVAFSTVIAAMNRIEYYRILRIVGGSKMFITFTLMLKYAVIGFAGSMLALALLDRAAEALLAGLGAQGLFSAVRIGDGLRGMIIAYGVILPLVSTIPAVLKLNAAALSGD